MKKRTFRHSLACLVSLVATASPVAHAAEAGAWESFLSEANADAWTVYDFADETYNYADWFFAEPDEDYIYLFHQGDAPLWFFIDEPGNAGNGALIGNYLTEDIQAVRVSAFINSLNTFDYLYCVIYATGPSGPRYFYSEPFLNEDFDESGWWRLRFAFDETWYYYDGTKFVATAVTDQMLSTIEELGFWFSPKNNVADAGYAAIDDVLLEPKVVAPALQVSATATAFQMAFTPAKANFCVIETWTPGATPAWSDVAGQTYVTGPERYVFTTPLAGRGIYRVSSFADYNPFITTPQE
jgi:hypothetical protein